MLANLLPGFRHTRTPLVAGGLWLLIAWVGFGPSLVPSQSHGLVGRRLAELNSLLGPHVWLAALALASVLVGNIAPRIPLAGLLRTFHINQGGRVGNELTLRLFGMGLKSSYAARQGDFSNWIHRTAQTVPAIITWADYTGRICPPEMQVWARDLADPDLDSVLIRGRAYRRDEMAGHPKGEGVPHAWLYWVLADESIETEIAGELPQRLQVEKESLYDEWDRVRSEADLRAAIVIPLLVLIGLLAATESAYWAVAGLLPLWLLRQGVQSQLEADQKLRSAVRYGAVESSTIEFLDALTERYSDEGE